MQHAQVSGFTCHHLHVALQIGIQNREQFLDVVANKIRTPAGRIGSRGECLRADRAEDGLHVGNHLLVVAAFFHRVGGKHVHGHHHTALFEELAELGHGRTAHRGQRRQHHHAVGFIRKFERVAFQLGLIEEVRIGHVKIPQFLRHAIHQVAIEQIDLLHGIGVPIRRRCEVRFRVGPGGFGGLEQQNVGVVAAAVVHVGDAARVIGVVLEVLPVGLMEEPITREFDARRVIVERVRDEQAGAPHAEHVGSEPHLLHVQIGLAALHALVFHREARVAEVRHRTGHF